MKFRPTFLCCMIGLMGLSASHAQLTVRNDAYVFVDDQVVFVKDDVNLTEANSKIYLRNESQLVQGDGTTGNSGLGQLSVQQNGTTHAFAYNYWCSPVGNNSAAAGNEDFRVNLIDESTGLTSSNDATFTTALEGTSSPFAISSNWLYTFQSSDQYSGWVYQGSAGAISPGLGFSMKGTNGSGNNQLYDFRGKPNTGTITNTVGNDVFTLIGNPYPSAVDAVEFIHDTDNTAAINGVLYFWEQDLSVTSHVLEDYVGGYALYTISSDGMTETYIHAPFNTYNSDGTINAAGSPRTSGKNLGRYIPIGQGFMVRGLATSSGTVTMKNSHRVYQKESPANGEFFRTGQNTEESAFRAVPEDYQRFRLNIDFDDVYTRQLAQTFHSTNTTEGFDYGYDVPHNFSLANDVYWANAGSYYTAQAQPLDVASTVLPLEMYLSSEQTIRFRITDIQHFDAEQPIYFHDKATGTFTNLKEQDVELTLNADYYAGRFEIVFSSNLLSNDEVISEAYDIRHIVLENELHISNFNTAIENITVFDMLGKEVYTYNHLGLKNKHIIKTDGLANGVYIAKIVGENGETVTKKFFAAE